MGKGCLGGGVDGCTPYPATFLSQVISLVLSSLSGVGGWVCGRDTSVLSEGGYPILSGGGRVGKEDAPNPVCWVGWSRVGYPCPV